jgi:hypothetical protein
LTTPATGRQITSACNGVTKVFNCPVFLNNADLRVYLVGSVFGANANATRLYEGTDYTLSGDPRAGTAKVTTVATFGASVYIRCWRVSSRAQTNDYVPDDGFPAEAHEIALDRLSLVDEEHDDDLSCTIHAAPGDQINVLPSAADRGGKFMQFLANGRDILMLSALDLATAIAPSLAPLLAFIKKGDPGSPGEGYSTRAAMALAGNTATAGDDAYYTDPLSGGKFVFRIPAPGTEAAFAALVAADTRKGIYIARQGDPTGVTGAWVREWNGIEIDPRWMDGKFDKVSDVGPAVLAAVALADALFTAKSGVFDGYGNGSSPGILIPGHGNMYAATISPQHAMCFRGVGTGLAATSLSALKFNDGIIGFDISVTGVEIGGLALYGGFTGAEGEYHLIRSSKRIYLHDLQLENASGDAINLDCSLPAGNCNGTIIERIRVQGCRNALNFKAGGDNSACSFRAFDIAACRQYGIIDDTFLANGHSDHEVDQCGITSWNDGVNIGVSVVSYSGNRYFAIDGQDAWCKINPPSGTTADNQGWEYSGPGGALPVVGIFVWYNGIKVRAGGWGRALNLNAPTGFVNCYYEGGQGKPQLGGLAFGIGGNLSNNIYHGSVNAPGGAGLIGSVNGLQVSAPVRSSRGYYGTDEAMAQSLGFKSNTMKCFGWMQATVNFPNGINFWTIVGADLAPYVYSNNGVYPLTITGPLTVEQLGTGVNQPGYVLLRRVALPDNTGNNFKKLNRAAHVAAPAGGAVIDVECRAQLTALINSLIAANQVS